jgi:hypothetical protein
MYAFGGIVWRAFINSFAGQCALMGSLIALAGERNFNLFLYSFAGEWVSCFPKCFRCRVGFPVFLNALAGELECMSDVLFSFFFSWFCMFTGAGS